MRLSLSDASKADKPVEVSGLLRSAVDYFKRRVFV